jgi:YesN/AraC family two-component response regulator
MRVLLIDDSILVLNTLERVLRRLGYQIVGKAKNGKEDLELSKSLSPDLIFLDLLMPIMDGNSIIRELTKLHVNAKTIIMTSYSKNHPIVVNAFDDGANGYIRKPVKDEDIKNITTKLFE